jgi:uncharacterized protein YhaN
MRIDQLELRAFGGFSGGPCLDFSQGSEGLHIVFGLNEAGKSTALRALTHALYGFPPRSADDYMHPYAKLRIGMSIRDGGRTLAFVRRKGTKNTIREHTDDSTVIDDAQLAEFLGGVDETLFRTLFGLDHDELVRGGQEILVGGGEIGKALFTAGSGLAAVHSVLEGLRSEADSLFSPRASKPALNAILASYKEASHALKDATISTKAWLEKERELIAAEEHKQKLQGSYAALDKEHRRLARFEKALPLITQRKETMAALTVLENVPRLREDFASFWQTALANLKNAERTRNTVQGKLEAKRTKRDSLVTDPQVLSQSESIEALWKDVNRLLAAREDREVVLAQVNDLKSEMQATLDGLRPGAPPQAAGKLRLSPKVRQEFQHLANTREAIKQERHRAQDEFDELQREQRRLQQTLEADSEVPDPRPLEEALRRIRLAGDIEGRKNQLDSEAARVEHEAEILVGRLGGGWRGSIEELEKSAVPDEETIERFGAQTDAADEEVRHCQDRCDRLAKEHAEIKEQLSVVESGGSFPIEEDLGQSRETRNSGWQLVRRQWVAGHSPEDMAEKDVQEYVTALNERGNLADAFVRAVEGADATADALRDASDQLTKRAHLKQALESKAADLASASRELACANDTRERVLGAWQQAWAAAGATPLPPREMASWLRRRASVLEMTARTRQALCEVASLSRSIAQYRGEIRDLLAAFDVKPLSTQANLAQWIEQGEITVKDATERRRQQTTRLEDLDAIRTTRLPDAKHAAETAEAAWADWCVRWKNVMVEMDLAEDTELETAQEVADQYSTLADTWQQIQTLQTRVDAMTRFESEFVSRTDGLCQHIAADLVKLPADQAAQELHSRLKSNLDALKQGQTLKDEYASLEDELEQAETEVAQYRAELEQACLEAGVSSTDEIPSVESKAFERRELERTREQLDERLADLAGGESLEEFLSAVEEEEPDTLTARSDELSERLAELQEEQSECVNVLAELRVRFEDLNQHEEASLAAETLEALTSEGMEVAADYLRLKAAEAVLLATMERYRLQNQAPLLGRTADIFRALTLDSFIGLRTDFDDRGEQVLVGVRQDGDSALKVAGMSDGTRDQLFLALRLASIEQYADKHIAVPLVVDDILVNFDDERAAATLKTLAELSEKVQVIFFTHHQHLMDIAGREIDPNLLFTHVLT